MEEPSIEQYRYFLKDTIRRKTDFSSTDQSLGVPSLPIEKPYSPNAGRTGLERNDRARTGLWTNLVATFRFTTVLNRDATLKGPLRQEQSCWESRDQSHLIYREFESTLSKQAENRQSGIKE